MVLAAVCSRVCVCPPFPRPDGTLLSVWRRPQPPPPLPPNLHTPHPCGRAGNRGGSAVPVPAGHTQQAGWRTKPLALPVKASHASTLSLSSTHAVVRGTRCAAVVVFLYQRDSSPGEEESVFGILWNIALSVLLLTSWDAGWAQGEQQVGNIERWVMSSSPRQPGVCLLFS